MSGVWFNAAIELPEDKKIVLAVKELKNGRREICLAHCIREYTYRDYHTGEDKTEPYWVTGGGNRNVIYWMNLPKIPEK